MFHHKPDYFLSSLAFIPPFRFLWIAGFLSKQNLQPCLRALECQWYLGPSSEKLSSNSCLYFLLLYTPHVKGWCGNRFCSCGNRFHESERSLAFVGWCVAGAGWGTNDIEETKNRNCVDELLRNVALKKTVWFMSKSLPQAMICHI